MSITRLIPGGDTITRLSPGGEAIARVAPGGEAIARSVPGGESVTRIIPPTAAEEAGDSFASYINDIETLAAWWSPNAKEAGDLSDDAVAMTQLGPDDNPDLLAVVASTGNFRVVEDNIGTTDSLTSAIESIQSDASNFVGIDSGTAQSTELADCLTRTTGAKSGFAFFKNAGANWGSANYGNIFQFDGDSSSTSADLAGHLALGFYKGTASLGKIRMSVPQELGINGASFMVVDAWYFIGWRQTDTHDFTIYTARVGVEWASRQEISGTSDHSHDGLTLGLAMKNSGAQQWDGWRWGPIGFFTSDIDEDGLEAIFESIE